MTRKNDRVYLIVCAEILGFSVFAVQFWLFIHKKPEIA